MSAAPDLKTCYTFSTIESAVQALAAATNPDLAWYSGAQAVALKKLRPRIECYLENVNIFSSPPHYQMVINPDTGTPERRVNGWQGQLRTMVITPTVPGNLPPINGTEMPTREQTQAASAQASYDFHWQYRSFVESVLATVDVQLQDNGTLLPYHEVARCWDAGASSKITPQEGAYVSSLNHNLIFNIRSDAWPAGLGGGPPSQPDSNDSFVRMQYAHAYPSLSAAFTSANKAGNAIVVAVSGVINTGFLNVSDSQGNSYQQVVINGGGSNQGLLNIWVAFNIKAGANTVTVTTASNDAGTDDVGLTVVEYYGISAVDSFVSSSSQTSFNPSFVTITTSGTNVMFFGAWSEERFPLNHSYAAIAPGTYGYIGAPLALPGAVSGQRINFDNAHYDQQFEWLGTNGGGINGGSYTAFIDASMNLYNWTVVAFR